MLFPQLHNAVHRGVERGLHSCVQIYVSRDETVLYDDVIGDPAGDHPVTSDSWMLWRSAGKPVAAVGILRLVEQQTLSLSAPLSDCLPSAIGTVFASLTLQQLLTHATGLPPLATRWPNAAWSDIIAGILHTSKQPEHDLAAYQPQATWFLLGEILRETTNTDSFSQVLQREVLDPLQLNDCACGVAADHQKRLGFRLPQLWQRVAGSLQPSEFASGPHLQQTSPGGNLRGPMRELGRFYEMLLKQGTAASGEKFLQPETVALMTQRHRVDLFDHTLQAQVDMGLGCQIDSQHYGRMVPYGYGRFCSDTTFGHGGAQCSMAFCDPVHRLVVAWAADAFCGEPQHQRRNRDINEAIYGDLDLNQPA